MSMLLILLLLATSFPVPTYAGKSVPQTDSSVRLMIKYKDSVNEPEKDLQAKIRNKKIKSLKTSKNENTYVIEVDSTLVSEISKDTNIEIVEVDSLIRLFENDGTLAPPEPEECTDESHNHQSNVIETHEDIENCTDEAHDHELIENVTEGSENVECECVDCIDCASHENCALEENHACEDCKCENGVCSSENAACGCTENNDATGKLESVTIENITYLPENHFLETGVDSKNSKAGDLYGWFVTRIKADVLHNLNYFGDGVKVAMFDTGVNTSSGDLDLAGGISFVDGVSSFADDNGHGTKMASILSANLNGQGLAGIAPGIELYSVKVLDQNGVGRYSNVLNAVEWAIDNDIQIITMSFGGVEYSQILREAINRAVNNNILVVAAAGNGGSNGVYYPAAFSEVIAVASSDGENKLASFSNFGNEVDIVAPGTNLMAYGLDGSVVESQGSSLSVQQVAGAASLLINIKPSLTNGQIKFLLYANTSKQEGFENFGHGLLNIEQAYENLQSGNYSVVRVNESGEPFSISGDTIVGGDGLIVAQAVCYHVYTNNCDTTCNECGYSRSINHVYSNSCDSYCNVCSYYRSISHTYSNSCDTMCNVCGYYRSAYHTYSNNCDASCNVCGTTRSITHTYSNSCDSSCNVCGATRSVSHNFSDNCDAVCNTCSATRVPPHTYSYSCDSMCNNCTASRSVTHTYTNTCDTSCNVCAEARSISHTYTNNCDTVCNVCSYTRNITHTYTDSCDTNCNVCGFVRSVPHVFTDSCDTTCNNCTYTRSISHTYTNSCDGTCNVCGVSRSVNHSFDNACDAVCNVCSYTRGVTHVYDNSCDSNCNICSFYRQVTHTYSQATCTKDSVCTKCGDFHSSKLGHNFGSVSYYQEHYSGNQDIRYKRCITCQAIEVVAYVSCECHSHDYSTKIVSQTHTANGHYYYWQCSCGDTVGGGYQTSGSCISCTTPPSVSLVLPVGGQKYSETSGSVKPKINIRDNENDTLTCKYFIDSNTTPIATQVVSNTSVAKVIEFSTGFDVSALSEGLHTLKVEVSDGQSPVGVASQSFQVDKSNPVLQSFDLQPSSNGFSAYVNGYDSVAGLHDSPYRLVIEAIGFDSGWISNGSIIPSSTMSPNKSYVVKAMLKDSLGHIYETSKTVWTLSAVPKLEIEDVLSNSIRVSFTDNNPAETLYEVKIGNQYVSSAGSLVSSPTDIQISSKQLTISGLDSGVTYTIFAKAKLNDNSYTQQSDEVTFETLPSIPNSPEGLLSSQITQTSALIEWNQVSAADEYLVSLNGIDQGSTGPENRLLLENLNPGTQYAIRVKSVNAGGSSEWSTVHELTTLPLLGVSLTPEPSVIKLSWEAVPGFSTYDLLINETDYHQVNGTSFELPVTEYDVAYGFQIKVNNPASPSNYSIPSVVYTLSNKPANLSVVSKTANSFSAVWQANGNPESIRYQIEAVESVNGVIKEGGTRKSNAWTYNLFDEITGLKSNQEYIILLKSKNSAGVINEEQISIIDKTLNVAPDSPTNIISTSTDDSIRLTWSPVNGAASYKVYRDGVLIGENVSENIFTDTGTPALAGLTPNTSYQYTITAVNEFGEGVPSTAINKRTLPQLPDVPTNIVANSSKTSVTLTWDSTLNTTGYEVEFNGSIMSSGIVNQITITGLEDGTAFTYRVRSRNEGGKTPWTELKMIETLPGTPNIPSNIKAVSDENSLLIEWEAANKAKEYEVEVNGVTVVTTNMTNALIEALTPQTEYAIRIRSSNVSEYSDWSATMQFSTTSDPIGAPKLQNVVSGLSSVSIDWSVIPDALGYVVEVDDIVVQSSVQGTTYSINDLEHSATYGIRIGARMPNDVIVFSNKQLVSTLPSGIDITSIETTPVFALINWSSNQSVSGYEIEINGVVKNVGNVLQYVSTGDEFLPVNSYRIRGYNKGGYSQWSDIQTVERPASVSNVPQNIQIEAFGEHALVSWNLNAAVHHYEYKVDGSVPVSTNDALVDITGLTANTEYSFSVRAVLDAEGVEFSDWSDAISFTTLNGAPNVPTDIVFDVQSDKILMSWSEVSGATSYEVMVDGVTVAVGTNLEYLDAGLMPESEHNYRVRSVMNGIKSEWSQESTIFTQVGLPGVPTNIIGTSTLNTITFSWTAVENATGYVLSIEGQPELITSNVPEYTFSSLSEATIIKVRVSAIVDEKQSPFSTSVSCSTSLSVPSGVISNLSGTSVTLNWNSVPNATVYEVEVDGIVVGSTSETSYLIENIEKGNAIVVRIRAKNAFKAKSEWSEALTISAAPIEATIEISNNEIFDMTLRAENIKNFSDYQFTIEYDPAKLAVIDLYSLSNNIELGIGNIPDTSIKIVSFTPGQVKFEILESILLGKTWSGIVTVIKFEALTSGQTEISYRIK